MNDIDAFASSLLEEAKRFFELGRDSDEGNSQAAYLHAALMIGFCAFEAHINAIGDELSIGHNLTPHEVGLILERDVKLENGVFEVKAVLKISRLEDRILFLFSKYDRPIDRNDNWWINFKSALALRNNLTHPKSVPQITIASTEAALSSLIEATDRVYRAVYKTGLPAAIRGMHSSLDFGR